MEKASICELQEVLLRHLAVAMSEYILERFEQTPAQRQHYAKFVGNFKFLEGLILRLEPSADRRAVNDKI